MVLVVGALVAGCSSASTETAPPATTPDSGILAGYPTDHDAVSPLLISALAPAPVPVMGTDGKVHVVYELEVLNFSPREATPTRLETVVGGPDGEVVSTLEGEDLARQTLVVLGEGGSIPLGDTGVILVDDVYDSHDDVPVSVTHRLSATFGPASPDLADAWESSFDGDPVTATGGPVAISSESPVVIGPPLAGAGWYAWNGCCGPSTHRRSFFPVGGRLNFGERYGVDWVKPDLTLDAAAIAASIEAGYLPTFEDDPTDNDAYGAYGEPLLAVADGTVVTVTSGMPDELPESAPTGLSAAELGGNYVVLDIGDGVYAFYAHLSPGGATVEVGDEVTRGQVIGRVGNSGNTTEAHLHFHLMRAPAPLSGDNVAFEIDAFGYAGSMDLEADPFEGFTPGPDAGARADQLPLETSVVDFPEVR
ncbi:M23 family metallopeptidase [Ilumatobacter sp.]|uniref:M23 family metallopeptidase n=1 Tax=Ilumatobacter sp. TaxID=1967498 RepID=UPI003C48F528